MVPLVWSINKFLFKNITWICNNFTIPAEKYMMYIILNTEIGLKIFNKTWFKKKQKNIHYFDRISLSKALNKNEIMGNIL